jgi:hypothetical protein
VTTDGSVPSPDVDTDAAVQIDRARAMGAGLAMLVVVLSYGASRFGDSHRWWAAGAAIVIGMLLADGLAAIRTALPTPGVAPLTIVAALVAIFLCVPETGQLPVVALLPAALVALEVAHRRQMPLEWYVVAAAAVGWGGLFGATGRQSALAGALFAWWAVLLPAFVVARRRIATPWRARAIASVAALWVVVVARTGGIADDWATIIVSVVAAVVVSVVAAVAIAGRPADQSTA